MCSAVNDISVNGQPCFHTFHNISALHHFKRKLKPFKFKTCYVYIDDGMRICTSVAKYCTYSETL